MKRIIALALIAVAMCLSFAGCMQNADNADKTATEAVKSSRIDPTEYKGRETAAQSPTKSIAGEMTEIMEDVATEWDDMVEDGQVGDGDGNIGDRENADGDTNIDEEAAERARENADDTDGE